MNFEYLYRSVVNFFDSEPFDDLTTEQMVLKFRGEAWEFSDAPDGSEMADVILCLIGWWHRGGGTYETFVSTVAGKHLQNEHRAWYRKPDGTFQHVEGTP